MLRQIAGIVNQSAVVDAAGDRAADNLNTHVVAGDGAAYAVGDAAGDCAAVDADTRIGAGNGAAVLDAAADGTAFYIYSCIQRTQNRAAVADSA